MVWAAGRKADRPSAMEALAIAMAWFASARHSVHSAAWRIEQDEDGAVIIVTGGDAPGLCITPEDGGFSLLAWQASGEQSETGPYASLDAALAAATKVLLNYAAYEEAEPRGHA